MTVKCKFCGNEKRVKAHGLPAIVLVQVGDDAVICNVCVSKAKALMTDVAYVDDKIIEIVSPLSLELA